MSRYPHDNRAFANDFVYQPGRSTNPRARAPAPVITRTAGTDDYGVYVTVSADLPPDDPEHGTRFIAKRVYLGGDEDGDEQSIRLAEWGVATTLRCRAALRARAEGGAA